MDAGKSLCQNMMGHCLTCRHWSNQSAGVGVCRRIDVDRSGSPKAPCLVPVTITGKPTPSTDLLTPSDFGCTEHSGSH
jgi:hypothetical protein